MLLEVCAGRGFDERRDTALVLFLLDIGARLSEAANMEVSDLDWDLEVVCGPRRLSGVRDRDRHPRRGVGREGVPQDSTTGAETAGTHLASTLGNRARFATRILRESAPSPQGWDLR
jgi:integrase